MVGDVLLILYFHISDFTFTLLQAAYHLTHATFQVVKLHLLFYYATPAYFAYQTLTPADLACRGRP